MTLADPYGGLQPYRCSEFGHTCQGQSPPHDLPVGVDTLALDNCASAEDGVRLSRVSDFVDFLKRLKPDDPDRIFVSALAGPPVPYVVGKKAFETVSGVPEMQPTLWPSCVGAGGESGYPSVRVKNWLDSFALNAVLESVCANDFVKVLTQLASSAGVGHANCIQGTVATRNDGVPDCQVVELLFGDSGAFIDHEIPICDIHQSNFPCWKLSTSFICLSGPKFQVCHDPTCSPVVNQPDTEDIFVSCSLRPPC